MKILILNTSNQYWGAEKSLLIFLKSLDPNEYSLMIKSKGFGLTDILERFGIKYTKNELELSPKKLKFYLSIIFIIKHIYKNKIKIIYSNNEDASSLLAFIKIISFFKIKTKIHIRNIPKKFIYYKHFMFFHNCIICNSNLTKKKLLDGVCLNLKSNIHVIYNSHGQNNSNFFKKDYSNGSFFMTAGRIERTKGQFDIVNIINNYKNDMDLKYYIIGDQNSEHSIVLKKFIEENNLSSLISLQSFTDNLSNFYSNAIATIVPSLKDTESFGRTVIESGYFGTPVIVRNIEPFTEFIIDNENGVIWDGTDKHLIKIFKRLLVNTQYRKFLGENLKKLVITNFSDQNYIYKLKKIIFF